MDGELREVLGRDPREAFPSVEIIPTLEPVSGLAGVCILCESGYHDAQWEVTHVMECGCPCHGHETVGKQ